MHIRDIRLHRSQKVAIGIAAAIALWFLSGLVGRADGDAQKAGDAETARTALAQVRVATSTATERRRVISIRGRTEAKRTVELRSETQGTVSELPVEKGARVAKDQTVCALGLDARGAQLAEAVALARQRKLEYDASRQLAEKGYRSPTQAAGAKAAYDAAQARLKQMQIEVGQTKIVAPFAGTLDDRPVEVGDYLRTGDVCGVVVELDPLLVMGQVAEDKVGALTVGMKGSARLVTGETVEGTIRFVARTADAATRTFRVELEVPNADFAMRAGVTAEIAVPGNEVLAHRIPSSVIALDDKGAVGVRTIDAEGRVRFDKVQLIDDTPDGLWVAGLPPTVKLIVVGQDYVKEGDKVDAVAVASTGGEL